MLFFFFFLRIPEQSAKLKVKNNEHIHIFTNKILPIKKPKGYYFEKQLESKSCHNKHNPGWSVEACHLLT